MNMWHVYFTSKYLRATIIIFLVSLTAIILVHHNNVVHCRYETIIQIVFVIIIVGSVFGKDAQIHSINLLKKHTKMSSTFSHCLFLN